MLAVFGSTAADDSRLHAEVGSIRIAHGILTLFLCPSPERSAFPYAGVQEEVENETLGDCLHLRR